MDHEIFKTLLNRVVSLSIALEQERAGRISADIKASERRLDVAEVFNLMAHMAGNRKIDAIRAYRSVTGAGLVDSKTAVESVMNRGQTL